MKIKELIEKLEQKGSHQFLKAVSKPKLLTNLVINYFTFFKIGIWYKTVYSFVLKCYLNVDSIPFVL